MSTWLSCDSSVASGNLKAHPCRIVMTMLANLVLALARLVKRIANFRLRSKRLTLDIERETVLFEVDVHKQTSLDLRIDYGNECE